MIKPVPFQKFVTMSNYSRLDKKVCYPNNSFEPINKVKFPDVITDLKTLTKTYLNFTQDKKVNFGKAYTPDFLFDPVALGKEKMCIVIYDENGCTVGAFTRKGCGFCRAAGLPLLGSFDGDLNEYAKLAEEMGYTVEVYENDDGPTYAEIYKEIYGIDYMDMVNKDIDELLQKSDNSN